MGFLHCHTLVVFFFACFSTIYAQCVDPGNKTVALPIFNPALYQYGLEVTVEDLNETFAIDEYFDLAKQTAFYYFDCYKGTTKYALDYVQNQTFVVVDDKCNVKDLFTNQVDASLFGMGIENGPLNITHKFYLDRQQNSTHMGKAMIEGIEVDHFQTCMFFNETNLTYNADIYYRSDSLKLNDGSQPIPMRLILNFTDKVASKLSTKVYSYRFFDVQARKLLWWPELPFDMVCKDRKDIPSTPLPPSLYMLKTEIYIPELKTLILDNGWYDYNNKLYRAVIDGITVVHDFHQGVEFQINESVGNCSINSLSVGPFYDVKQVTTKNNKTLFMMRTPLDFLNQVNLTYGGHGVYYGIDTDAWIAPHPAVQKDYLFNADTANLYNTYFYTRATVGKPKIIGVKTFYIAKYNSSYSVNHTLFTRVFDYSESFDQQSTFDVSTCYNESMKETFIIKFSSDNYQMITQNPNAFKKSLIKIVVLHANISFNRVKSSITYGLADTMNSNGDNTTYFYVWVTLLGVAPAKGNSIELLPQLNLIEAVQNLQAVLMDNRFTVSFDAVGCNKTLTMTAFPDYFKSQSELLSPSGTPQPSPQSQGLGTGEVVGISVAMLVVGVIIGFLVMLWRSKHSRGNYAYTMQD